MTTSTPTPTNAGRAGSWLGLRAALLLDAGVSGVNGLVYVTAAAVLPALLPDLLGPATAAAGLLPLTAAGLVWCLLQASVVTGFAALQGAALRREG